jgi:phosphate transport system substrate-binding protein
MRISEFLASADFKDTVGSGTAVKWPTGLGGKGNEGVAANVQRIRNSIGYVEYAYAKRNSISHAQLRNRDGQFVQPEESSFQAAAAGAEWAKTPGFAVLLTNQPGKGSWPITGASFILMHKSQANPDKAAEVLKFFDWSFKNGDGMASELDYVAMPDEVVTLIRMRGKSS